jgi:hypothetical protein
LQSPQDLSNMVFRVEQDLHFVLVRHMVNLYRHQQMIHFRLALPCQSMFE